MEPSRCPGDLVLIPARGEHRRVPLPHHRLVAVLGNRIETTNGQITHQPGLAHHRPLPPGACPLTPATLCAGALLILGLA